MLATISSSKPSMDSICFSIHCDMTAVFTFVKSTGLAKEGGNFVERRSLFWAVLEAMDAVPLIDGILSSSLLQSSLKVVIRWHCVFPK